MKFLRSTIHHKIIEKKEVYILIFYFFLSEKYNRRANTKKPN